MKIDWAVSGRKKAYEEPSSIGPTLVLNIKLNALGSVRLVEPQFGQVASEI